MTGRFSRGLVKLLLAVGAVMVALLAAEIVTRMTGFSSRVGRGMFVREPATRTFGSVALWSAQQPRYDADDVRRASTAPGAFTILGLGDSIMYGVWLGRAETYLEQARRALAGRATRPVEILNLAVPGYNTLQESAVYEELDGRIRPDMVVVHYWGGDDAHQYRVLAGYVVDFGNVSDDGRVLSQALPLPAAVGDFLLVHSRLYDLVAQVVSAREHPRRVDWTRVSKPLAAIQERARRAGARVLVLASPELDPAAIKTTPDLPLLREFAATHGVEVIDLADWLRDVPAARVRLDGCHFNAEGHRILGERLADYLLEHDLHE